MEADNVTKSRRLLEHLCLAQPFELRWRLETMLPAKLWRALLNPISVYHVY